MYSSLYRLCQYESQSPRVVTTNRHFLDPENQIYCPFSRESRRIDFAPEKWGPDAWNFLFTVAAGYSLKPTYSEKIEMRRFLESLRGTLPCSRCRSNFSREVVRLNDEDLASPKTVKTWLENLRVRIKKRKETEGN